MKTFVIVGNTATDSEDKRPRLPGWHLLADSAVSNTGKPFYVPEVESPTEARVSFAVRIERLGKSIAEKFSRRYFSQMAPALNFRLPRLYDKLSEEGLSGDPALNFDKALFVGDFIPYTNDATLKLYKNGEPVASFDFSMLERGVEALIPFVSEMNTLKIGDLLLPGLSQGVEVKEGDVLEIRVNDSPAFQVKIK